MTLNADKEWSEVGDISTGRHTNPETSLEEVTRVRDAFKGKDAKKELLGKGMLLYKFNEYNTLGPIPIPQTTPSDSPEWCKYYEQTLSPWWSPYFEFEHDPGWAQKKRIASNFGVSVREWGRLTSAVKENWNSLRYLLVITLDLPVYGFFGGFAKMLRIDRDSATRRLTTRPVGFLGNFREEGRGKGKYLPGGGTQFYIPGLTPRDVSEWYVEDLIGH